MSVRQIMEWVIIVFVLIWSSVASGGATGEKTARLWEPVEWRFENASFSGNPFDLVARGVFTHRASRLQIRTELFYSGRNQWTLRFTGTRTGRWTFVTESADPELDGRKGAVEVTANPSAAGFLTKYGSKWGRGGVDKAFVPQYVMFYGPQEIYRNPRLVEEGIKTFFDGHGFNGFHSYVFCRWFDINQERADGIKSKDPSPDMRTFEALEMLIRKTHAAGGVVHLWVWGDESRRQTPIRLGGKNGPVDRRLQRYICARLGPLPGWSLGYGFDLDEWVKEKDLRLWHDYMHKHLGWFHFLGGRTMGPNHYQPGIAFPQIHEGLDYASYEQHRPSYEAYVAALGARPGKPVFSEDRFRVRRQVYPKKDYDLALTRRGLWHSTMAGGVANIWGYLLGRERSACSGVYPNKAQLLTYARFFKNRFKKAMVRDNALTDGVCLKVPDGIYVFYKEDTERIEMDLGAMTVARRAVAVDAKKGYQEIDLGRFAPGSHVFEARYRSDWAVAVE